MSVRATVALREEGAPDLLVEYADAVEELPIGPDAKRLRRNAARQLLTSHPDLEVWMARPTPARLVDLHRSGAWCFLCWCFFEGYLRPDLDLLLAKTPGDLYLAWAERHDEDLGRLREVAARFSWCANWTKQLSAGLAMICLWSGRSIEELDDALFDEFLRALDDCPSATSAARSHNGARAYSLHQACYELGICQLTPRKNRPPAATLDETLLAIPQPDIRRVARRYLEVVASTLRPSTVLLRADSLIVLGEYLAAHHPDLKRLDQLERQHLEGFLVWNRGRPWRGWLARDKPVAARSPSTP